MGFVYHEVEVVGQVVVETHFGTAYFAHILHTAHKFALGNHNRQRISTERVELYCKVLVGVFGCLAVENGCEILFLVVGERRFGSVFLADQLVESVGVNAHKADVGVFLFLLVDKVGVECAVEYQHVVTF